MERNEPNELLVQNVFSIKKIVKDISDEKPKIYECHNKMMDSLEQAGSMIVGKNDVMDAWLDLKKQIMEFTQNLKNLLEKLFEKLKNKDAEGLGELWGERKQYSTILKVKLQEMRNLGELVFVEENLDRWNGYWNGIKEAYLSLWDISETMSLKLLMIEKLEPEEIDEITKDIVKHLPLDYTQEEVLKYKDEYMQAYRELKEETSKKKNLWDKFMDILAGGIQETPAHRVQMRRWMDGI